MCSPYNFNIMRHAGPLWRDEISSLRAATMRLWNFLDWGASDEGLRTLGLLIGLGVPGAIWLAAWTIKSRSVRLTNIDFTAK
jgi:hypothetical protein